ncbi:MAG: protein kinase [Verrucomicrobia bacterium]|nr:protein kinase [Verrucomicrobiota bacterium]
MNQLMEHPSEIVPQAPPAPAPVTRPCERRTLLFVAVNCRSTQTEADNLTLTQRHATLVRDMLAKLKVGEEIGRFGESFFIQFNQSTIALRFALQLQVNIRALAEEIHQPVFEQISLDFVDVPMAEDGSSGDMAEAYQKHTPVCRALAGFTQGKQILLTRPIFDELRLAIKKEDLKPFGVFVWFNHGPCDIAGVETPADVCEIREGADGADQRPTGLQRAPARGPEDETAVWGWRPGPGAAIPGTRFTLEEKLADGRFGEEWSGGEPNVKEKRLFRFCVRKDWISQIKEHEAVLQTVRKKAGQTPNLLAIQGLSLDQPPYYFLTELFEGKDLLTWAKQRGGAQGIPFPARLEIIAQAATGLAAAHEGRILHRCLRPENILVAGSGMTPKDVQVKLAYFGVGHVALIPREEAGAPHEAPPVPAGETPPPSIEDMYKAPEVIAGQEPNVKSEVYSLAVILCQLILGNLSEPLTSKRMAEIVTVLKRDGLASLFAADPQARADGVSRVAGDLRAAIKEREARVTAQGPTSRREMIQRVVMISLSVVALLVIAIFGPKYLRRRLQQATDKDAKKKPGERGKTPDSKEEAASLTSEESRGGKTDSGEEEDTTSGSRTRSRPAGAVREKKKEESKESAQSFFNLVVLPIALVIILGTVVQQFGPKIKKLLFKPPPPPPPEA